MNLFSRILISFLETELVDILFKANLQGPDKISYFYFHVMKNFTLSVAQHQLSISQSIISNSSETLALFPQAPLSLFIIQPLSISFSFMASRTFAVPLIWSWEQGYGISRPTYDILARTRWRETFSVVLKGKHRRMCASKELKGVSLLNLMHSKNFLGSLDAPSAEIFQQCTCKELMSEVWWVRCNAEKTVNKEWGVTTAFFLDSKWFVKYKMRVWIALMWKEAVWCVQSEGYSCLKQTKNSWKQYSNQACTFDSLLIVNFAYEVASAG